MRFVSSNVLPPYLSMSRYSQAFRAVSGLNKGINRKLNAFEK